MTAGELTPADVLGLGPVVEALDAAGVGHGFDAGLVIVTGDTGTWTIGHVPELQPEPFVITYYRLAGAGDEGVRPAGPPQRLSSPMLAVTGELLAHLVGPGVPRPECGRCHIENKACARHCHPATCPDPDHHTDPEASVSGP